MLSDCLRPRALLAAGALSVLTALAVPALAAAAPNADYTFTPNTTSLSTAQDLHATAVTQNLPPGDYDWEVYYLDGSQPSDWWGKSDEYTPAFYNIMRSGQTSTTFRLSLTITDASLGSATVTKQFTVAALPPQVSITNDNSYCTPPGELVSFTDTSSDGNPMTPGDTGVEPDYHYDFGDGTSADGSQFDDPMGPTHTYATTGVYTVTDTVTNWYALRASSTIQVCVENPPVAAFSGPDFALVGHPVTYDASGSHVAASASASSAITGYGWSVADDADPAAGVTADGPTLTHTFTHSGYYDIGVTVTDSVGDETSQDGLADGNTLFNSGKLVVLDHGPLASFALAPAAPRTGQQVTFTDASTSSNFTPAAQLDILITSVHYDFGDSTQADGGASGTATHRYARAGRYTITERVGDETGFTASTTRTVTVAAGAPTPKRVCATVTSRLRGERVRTRLCATLISAPKRVCATVHATVKGRRVRRQVCATLKP